MNDKMKNSQAQGIGHGDDSLNPNPNRAMNFNDGPSASSFGGGQMMNPIAFMAQYQGMMGNNPQDMMNMMGAYCQAANGGGGNMGMGPMGMAGYSGFSNDGNSQGMASQAMATMRKRPTEGFDDDDQPPAAKRSNFGPDAADSVPPQSKSANDVDNSNNGSHDLDDEEKPSAAPRKDQVCIPPSKEGIKFYSRNDVLCGRGGGTNVHPGNRRFRDLINANRRAYLKARKNDKPAISRTIVRTIRDMNGRFLKKDEKLGLWFEIGDDGAREKTSQALRQRAPEMRKILFEDEQRQQQQQHHEMIQRHQFMGMGQGMGAMPGMGMAGMQGMGMQAMGGMSASAASMGGNQPVNNNGNNNDLLLAKYNMLHQKNWLAQEKNMILQRLAMSGINPNSLNNSQKNMTTQALLHQGMNSVIPRGA